MESQQEDRPLKKPTSRGSQMLQKRRAEVALNNLISTIISDDEKCHNYARQLVDAEIRTKGVLMKLVLIFLTIYCFR
jgi:hypothetical protein